MKLLVRASDRADFDDVIARFSTVTVVVRVGRDQAPPVIAPLAPVTISENVAVGDSLFQLVASDSDLKVE